MNSKKNPCSGGEKTLWFEYDDKSKGFTTKEKIKEQLWRIVEIVLFRPSPKLFSLWRVFLLRVFGAKIGNSCYISNWAIFIHPWNICIGNNCGIDDYVFIKGDKRIVIGNYVSIGNYSKIIPSGHDIRSRNFEHCGKPITIGNGAFIGANSFIGPGVSVGEMAVVGSCVNLYKNIPDNTVVITKVEYLYKERLGQEDFQNYVYE